MMSTSRKSGVSAVLIALYVLVFSDVVSALTISYCSSINTASTNKNTSIYQSNGLCHDFCDSSYAFAVLQDNACWCSDYVPGATTSVGDCNEPCPGYPPDICGAKGLFAYIALDTVPSGTKGASSAKSTSATSSPSVSTVAGVLAFLVLIPRKRYIITIPFLKPYPVMLLDMSSSTSTSSTLSSTSSTSSTTPKSTSHTTSWTPTPVTSVITVTGQAKTVVVTPTAPPDAAATAHKSSKGGLGTGGAVGLAIGLVALLAIIAAGVYFYIRKRRQETLASKIDSGSRSGSSSGLPGAVPSRSMSENSRYVLGTDGRQVIETWEPDALNKPGSRRSRLMPVDPRLDPFAPVYQRGGNTSRDSVNTLRDDHDYSRRVHQQGPILRATNPDPDDA
ncbi:hypothetical protein F5884DRAFT_476301 [Xylogone sp. PMI_703]|nr:hypothetical protein F5884DRAFT_476301 [Xylogone sp. PMI_703]